MLYSLLWQLQTLQNYVPCADFLDMYRIGCSESEHGH